MHKGNPEVIKMARRIGRTSDAIAYRLVNYASYDPQLKRRGISGMTHGGKKCEEYWNEFINDREKLIFESERILAQYEGISLETKFEKELKDLPLSILGETKISQVKARINQNIFRQIVLANYENKCALSSIDILELLVAGHIIPWSENEKKRLNPENGICLSSLYDKAFDQGFISFDETNKVIFSPRLLNNISKDYFKKYFLPIHRKVLAQGKKYDVNPAFPEWHRDCIFNK